MHIRVLVVPKLTAATNLTAGRPMLLSSHCTCHYTLVPLAHRAPAGSRLGGKRDSAAPVRGRANDPLPELWAGPSEAGYGRGTVGPRGIWGSNGRFLMRAWHFAYRASLVPGPGSGSGHGA